MKIFLRLLLFTVALSIVYYGIKNIPLPALEDINQRIYLERNNARFLPDWTVDDVLTKINTAREKAGFMRVKTVDKLNQAALSRLSVILTEGDYSGSITGLTREKAVSNAGYAASTIGDLLLLDFFKTNDPIADWEGESTTKSTLLGADFKDVGIAVKNEQDKVNVYVLMMSPRRPTVPPTRKVSWGGLELWEVVNERRIELGVNPLGKRDELCTIASIRLNQLLELGKLDGHAGFVPILERADLKWISEKYNISEYLAAGYQTAQDTAKAWETTLGHRALLAGGEYVWGCVYAQNGFAVAIAAY